MHFLLQYTQPWCCVQKLPAVIFGFPIPLGFVCCDLGRVSQRGASLKQKIFILSLWDF